MRKQNSKTILLHYMEKYENHLKKKKIQEEMNKGVVAQLFNDDLLRGVT